MEIADNWSTEYNRKGFRVVLQEADWASLLIDAGVHPETVLPLAAKFQLLKLQAAIFSLEAMAEYLASDPAHGDAASVSRELAEKKGQMALWLGSMRQKYGKAQTAS